MQNKNKDNFTSILVFISSSFVKPLISRTIVRALFDILLKSRKLFVTLRNMSSMYSLEYNTYHLVAQYYRINGSNFNYLAQYNAHTVYYILDIQTRISNCGITRVHIIRTLIKYKHLS